MQFIIPLKRDDLLEPADQANAYVVENLLDVNEVDELKLQGLYNISYLNYINLLWIVVNAMFRCILKSNVGVLAFSCMGKVKVLTGASVS